MADIERERTEKARAVVGALQDGKLPTTAQAVSTIDDIKRDGTLHDAAKDMSPAGKKVLADAERILDSTRKVATETMPNNELQNAIYYGNRSASRSSAGLTGDQASSAADTLIQAGAASAQLAKQIVTSAEFRGLLTDISSLVQELVQSNIVDASDDLANDENAPDSVRQAAAKTRETVANNDLQEAGQQAANNAQGTLEQGKQAAYERKDQAQAQAQQVANEGQAAANNTRQTAGDSLAGGATLRDTAKNVIDTVADEAERRLPADQVNKASDAIREHGAKLHTGEESTSGLKDTALAQGQALLNQGRSAANQAASQLKDPNSQVRQTGERVARKLANLPEEKKREIVEKLKAVTRTIQSKPEFQNGIEDLLALLAPLAHQAKAVSGTAVNTVASIPNDPQQAQASKDSRLAVSNAKTLIENFADGKSLDPLVTELRGLAEDARDDDDLRVFYRDLGVYIQRTIKEPGYINQDSYTKEAEELVERGRQALDKYSYRTQNISYEAKNFAKGLANNKATSQLQSDTSTLFTDLFLDEKGNPSFKPDLLRDLTKCIPAIADKLAYLPIPRVEVDDGTYHMIFDNIILHSTILPKYIRVVTDTTIDATKTDPNDQFSNHIILEISNVEASARDIAWLFNKHSGFWKAGDVGLADFDIKKEGLSIRVKITPGSETGRLAEDTNSKGRYMHAAEVETTLHNLDLRLHDSHHDILYKLAKPMLNKTAKKQIEKAVSDSLKDIIFSLDEKLAQAAGAVAPVGGYAENKPKEGVPTSTWGSEAYGAK
ncbi:hypothetical protein HKX48_003880 [Thoreauomyces humboldtii]|nr:hypothetical protein HKX48_003880 [Thoreauomyces humboldtii]